MNSEVKVVEVVVVSVLTTSVVAVTLSFSVISALGRRVMVVVKTLPAATSASILIVPIPGKATSMMYPLPGGRGTIRNSPLASVTAPWFTPRESFLIVTRALGSGAPSLSTTVPLRPALLWANAGRQRVVKTTARQPASRRNRLASIGMNLRVGPQRPGTPKFAPALRSVLL